MKRTTYLSLATIACMLVTYAAAQSDSLADYAKSARKGKTAPAKIFDNDNLPKTNKLSVVGEETPEPSDEDSAKSAANDAVKDKSLEAKAATGENPEGKDKDKDKDAEAKSESEDGSGPETTLKPSPAKKAKSSSVEDPDQAAADEWKGKISEKKDKVEMLSRELDVLQREYRLRAAAFYADAGNRLRDSGGWDKEDSGYKQQIADKQKELESAKQELDDMKEDARKAGAPAAARE